MLKVKNLVKEYGAERVLNKISFTVAREHKIALVGYNGTGKSTLLKIIAGLEMPDKGQIEKEKNVTIGFLPQNPDSHNAENVLEFLKEYVGLNDEVFHRNIEIMFSGFALPTEVKNKRIGDLSSGQKTKVFLTGLLLKKVDLMLLDEPTNNLDLPALIWLEDFLQKTKSAFIVVSHDKKFLDNVARKIFEIDWKERTLSVSSGKYTDYLERKAKETRRQNMEHEAQQVDIKRLTNLAELKVEKARKGAKYQGPDNDRLLRGYRRDKAGDSYKDAKIFFNRIKRMDLINKIDKRKDFKIEIAPENSGNPRDIFVNNLICGYEDGFRIGPFSLDVPFGSRVCILGLNGSGKSTFLKTVTGKIKKIEGEVQISSGVKFGNLMQEHESLNLSETVFGFLKKRIEKEDEILVNHLVHFGFNEELLDNKIKNISPGARARLLLAYFAADNVNTLILDEPTNHLDIEAQEALEKTLDKFEGTVLIVTHDRFFVDRIKTQTLYVLQDGLFNKIQNFQEYVSDMEKRSRKLLRTLIQK